MSGVASDEQLVFVTLSFHELAVAAEVGWRRQVTNLAQRRRDRHAAAKGDVYDGWGKHIEGAAAELAFAKAFDRYWEPLAATPFVLPGDVGQVQVRSTARTDGRLIVHDEDPTAAAYVLAIGRAPTFALVGWAPGEEAKRPDYWWEPSDRGAPAYFVPRWAMRPMPELDAVLETAR